MSPNLEKLKLLTEQLSFRDIVERRHKNVIEMDMESGTCIGFSLFKTPKVSVARFFASKDSIMPQHKHESMEYIMVYEGEMKTTIYDEDGEIRQELGTTIGDSIRITPNYNHSHSFYYDTWAIVVTIPEEEGFPNE